MQSLGNSSNSPERTNHQSNTNRVNALLQENSTESNAIQIPEITLPQGGGALKGIDEKFEVNPANGTASFSIPIPFSHGRNEFTPSLSLSYNSGSGNSPFGLGWSLNLPMIQRKTDRQIPRYRSGAEEDVFIFSGVEDLVPLPPIEQEEKYPDNGTNGYTVKRYRPRIEGSFSRIEKITYHSPNLTDVSNGTYWKVTTPDNVVTIFGRNPEARIAHPQHANRIFRWLPEFSYDNRGNWLQYHYKSDHNFDTDGTLLNDDSIPYYLFENNRKNGLAPYTNTYLKRISYGNRNAYYAAPSTPYNPQRPTDEEYFFELVLDYGEHDEETPSPQEIQPWNYRPDAYSSYRSGFEVRTNRLCRRLLLFHHFADEFQYVGTQEQEVFGRNYLVRSLDLSYEPSSINGSGQSEVSYLQTMTQRGYIRKPDGTYSQKSLPALEFIYEQLNWNTSIQKVDKESIVNAPVGLTNNYQWVDLYNEGIPGILTEQGATWYYKSNQGFSEEIDSVAFSVAQKVMPKPSFNGLSNGVLSIQDLAANGKKQVVVNSPALKGYFELIPETDWDTFQTFEQQVNIDLRDPNIRLIDLNGDGQPDLVVSEENVWVWYAAKGKKGHAPAAYAAKVFDEEQGPVIVFADQIQTIFLADMSGDGLTDIVRIRNREICYWANMGYGKFSAKINMANAPNFDHLDSFNPQYLHLADVSGTGATDIIYLGKNQFKAFINLSGNAWSNAHEVAPFCPIDHHSRLSVTDLLGTGTSCIVWSSDLPAYTDAPMRYIDLMNSKKPHVLIHHKNNLGKETTLSYKSSTHFYLEDKKAGTPWTTRLPFPVQVIEKLIVEEKITDVRFSTTYSYHHGYYDHLEREFRGFGRVEQLDTEHYAEWQCNNEGNQLEKEVALYQPPTLTKTWYHTGAFLELESIQTQFEKEHWHQLFNRSFPDTPLTITDVATGAERAFSEPQLPDAIQSIEIQALRGDEYREAIRACKGMMLRQEVFGLDAPEAPPEDPELLPTYLQAIQKQRKPFSVTTRNCQIQLLQARTQNPHAVFLVTEREALTIHYEREESDFRLAHTLNTRVDELGNVLENASIVYGRQVAKAATDRAALESRVTDFSEEVLEGDTATMTSLQSAFRNHLSATETTQTQSHIIYTQNSFARHRTGVLESDDIDLPHAYRLRLPHETKTYEITSLTPSSSLYQLSDFNDVLNEDREIPYHQVAPSGIVHHRLIEWVKTKYRDNALNELNFGFYDALGLPFEDYQLAFTPELVQAIYSKSDGTALETNGIPVSNLMESSGRYTRIEDNFWIRSGKVYFKETPTEALSNVEIRFFSPLAFEDPFGARTSVVYDVETFTGTRRNNNGYYLFIKATENAIGSKIQIDVFNYRSLGPSRMIDSNANPSSIILDELGLVKALAVEGNGRYTDDIETSVTLLQAADNLEGITEYTEESEKDLVTTLFSTASASQTNTIQLRVIGQQLLQNATSRFIYNFADYKNIADQNAEFIADGQPENVQPLPPIVVGNILRGEHFAVNPESPIQFSFEYSDGLGNIAMTKTQAEPGLAYYVEDGVRLQKDTESDLRWIGNGRTVLNNKGNPVKQYEPYFSTNFLYENDPQLVEIGVTPVLFYDALGRGVKTLFPDGTLSKVEFDSWKQSTFDQNDTVLDPECTWYQRRTDATRPDFINDPKTREAADKAVIHANTPNSVYLDSLGRPVLSISHNGQDTSSRAKYYSSFIQLDIEGNPRTILDAKGNAVMTYRYDMLGNQIYQNSMDAGERWMFNNLMGNPVHSWDGKEQVFSTRYDVLQRPIENDVQTADRSVFLVERVIYGEEETNAVARNLRGQTYQQYDSSGRMTNQAFDFKGNLLEARRQMAAAIDADIIDWSTGSSTNRLEEEIFSLITEYDALNRMSRMYNWHRDQARASVYEPSYNERGNLFEENLTTTQRVAGGFSERSVQAVSAITYDEKGQLNQIRYGNGTITRYHYDQETFRLVQLKTTVSGVSNEISNRPSNLSDPNVLQNLYYTYDPVGNISEIEDDAYEPVFFRNQLVEPRSRYTYDALYRLAQSQGRENDTFNRAPIPTEPEASPASFPRTDRNLRNYTQNYRYDPLGNILLMTHLTPSERWRRSYTYAANSNRLLRSWRGTATTNAVNYGYDVHGNILNYNNTPAEFRPQWDYQDRVHQLNLGGGGTAYYQYGNDSERSRKRIVQTGGIIKERLYLGGMELYRRWNGSTLVEEIETYSLFVGEQRALLVENILQTDNTTLSETILDRYQYSNHLASVGLELDSEGAILSYEEYHPYGTVAYQASDARIRAIGKRYRYTGMERDAESGLNYHSARYYMPWLGRWLSADPIGVEGGMNLFSYVMNNPIMLRDIKGLDANDPQEDLDTLMLRAVGATSEQEAEQNLDRFLTSVAEAPFSYELIGTPSNIRVNRGGRFVPPSSTFSFNEPFRVYLPGGFEEFRPVEINEENRAVRDRMIDLIENSPLRRELRDLAVTSARRRAEHSAFILPSGNLGTISAGQYLYVNIPDRPSSTAGFVHTHAISTQILAPPSGGDIPNRQDFESNSIQLVVEARSGRVWGVFSPHYAGLLGRITPSGGFERLNPLDPLNDIVYQIVDADTIRMERFLQEKRETRERRSHRQERMEQLREEFRSRSQ